MKLVSGNLADGADLSGIHLTGMVTGNAVVSHGHADIQGMITGGLSVNEGASATIRGMVKGDLSVIGRVEVYGMIIGTISGDGEILIHPGVVVGND